ncbi:MAG: translation initiation factor IF-3 [Planctomycetota bacterium]|nr:translation initiation factor IF-3 [Planctomycetota bacterium]MEE3219132.1 translation initiation factor IF-3 [Planctomycetota bacterium]
MVSRSNWRNEKIERSQRLNEQIRITPVRVVDEEGEQLGIIETEEALQTARSKGMDLVEVGPNERPPVCRIMDFGKYKYQQKKRKHKNKTHVHHGRTKEIRIRPKIGQHDIDFKVNHAREFLEHKDKVSVAVIFRGRELAHMEEGRRVLQQFIEKLADIGKVEMPPSQQGRRIVCMLAPK